mgnify:CR=1 FL=1
MQTPVFEDLHWLLDVLQSTDIGILVLDRQYNVEMFNRFMQVHSGISGMDAVDRTIFELFPYLTDEWFTRRVNSVFDLGVPVYTTYQERDAVFDFPLKLPIHHETGSMYQNSTFVPLRSPTDIVEKVAIVIYDVTSTAVNSKKLEQAKEQLLYLSRTDKLTGLSNRGYWQECLEQEYHRNLRSEEPVTLVMLDIDHFKNVNDNYGHAVGDQAICQVSSTLLELSRTVDVCGRYGGEEFCVILPNTNIDGAMVFCERLRKAIEKLELNIDGQQLSFTISLGVAMLDNTVNSAHQWLVCADKALYASKEGGRNKTSVYQ